MSKSKTGDLPFIPYERVSRVGGRSGESYTTLAVQQRTIKAVAASRGVAIYPGSFVDEDESGGTVNRPAFQRALDLIRKGKAGGIIVATGDRFSRDTEDVLATLREIEERGGRVLAGDGDLSLQSGPEVMLTTIRAAVSSMYRIEKRNQLNGSRRDAIDRKVHIGIPFGYRRPGQVKGEPLLEGRGKPLEKDPREAPIVLLAFQLRAEGLSWKAIARRLNETGVYPAPRRINGQLRQAQWSHTTVARMLDREVYLGVAQSGSFRTEHAHDPIVTRKLWAQAHQSAGAKFKAKGDDHLLTGLARCGSCGHVLVRLGREPNIYYACHNEACTAKARCRKDELEAWTEAQFLSEIEDVELGLAMTNAEVGAAVAAVDQRRAEYDTAVRRMMTLPDDDQLLLDTAGRVVAEAKQALEAAQRELRRTQAAAQRVSLPDDFNAQTWSHLEVGEQRHLLSTYYAMIVVRRAATSMEPLSDRVRRVLRAEEVPTDKHGLVDLAQLLDW